MKHIIIRITVLFALSLLLNGCSDDRLSDVMRSLVKAPDATIERDVKGHEQIYSVQAILRISQKRADGESYAAYDISQRPSPIPVYQEINFSKDNEGNIAVVSDRKVFDVVKSKDFYYALELKYYDVNGSLINHQFSGYDPEDEDNSTLPVHQHFFTIQNYALGGYPLTYPMTPDSVYYDRYLFRTDSEGNRVESTLTSPSNVYAPSAGYQPNTLRYDLSLALKASEVSLTKEVGKPYQHPATGQVLKLYKTIDMARLDELVPEIFTYEYRDTDPVEEYLGSPITGQDDLGRIRAGSPTIRLRQKRSLLSGEPLDALGFKGILQFKQSNMVFQMRVCICHILTYRGKYDMLSNPGGVHGFNEISPAWNSFDIDYPIPFRVMADADGDRSQCVRDIQRFYPEAQSSELENMLWGGTSYFERFPRLTM